MQEKGLDISGYWLEENEWRKTKSINDGITTSIYVKKNSMITYDGCDWKLNGKKIKFVDEIIER